MSQLPLVIVVAMARNRVIGRDNGLPWRMRSDLKHFRAVTMGKPLLMGRKTYQSIGRPLPGREIVVITRDKAFRGEGIHVVDSLEGGFVLGDMLAKDKGAGEVIIAGGATIYEEAMPFADRMLITEIDIEAEGDARFPKIPEDEWEEVSRTPFPRGEGDDAAFAITVWDRRPGG